MMNQERPVLYINIWIHDASEAIKDEVAAKVKKSRIPGPLKESVANRAAARITWDLSTANKVIAKMGPRLCREIPIKMSKKGIQVHVESVHSEGSYLVQELQVQHVDAIVMAEARNKSVEKDREEETFTSSLFKGMFTVIGVQNQASLERDVLPNIVQRKVSVSICEMMQERLAAKKMTADVTVLQEDKQARYFFNTLRTVREEAKRAEEARRAMSPLRRVKVSPELRRSVTNSLSSVVEAAADVGAKEISTIVDRVKVAPTNEVSKKSTMDPTSSNTMAANSDSTETKRKKKVLHSKSSSLSHAVEAAAASMSATIKRTSVSSSADKVRKVGAKKSHQLEC